MGIDPVRNPAKEAGKDATENSPVGKSGTTPVGNSKKAVSNAPKAKRQQNNRQDIQNGAGGHTLDSTRVLKASKAAILAWEIAELTRVDLSGLNPVKANMIGSKVEQLLVVPASTPEDAFALACMAQRFSLSVVQTLAGKRQDCLIAAISHDLIRRAVLVLEEMTGVSSDAYLSNRDISLN